MDKKENAMIIWWNLIFDMYHKYIKDDIIYFYEDIKDSGPSITIYPNGRCVILASIISKFSEVFEKTYRESWKICKWCFETIFGINNIEFEMRLSI